MNKPDPFTRIFGNTVSAVLIVLFAIYVGIEWWAGAVSGVVALIVAIAAIAAINANERMRAYQAWQRDWQAMEGKAPRASPKGWTPLRRILVGVPAWLLMAYWALEAQKQPGPPAQAAGLFWIGSLGLAIGWAVRMFHSRQKAAAAQASRDIAVTQCLRVPTQSTALSQAYAALPEYCKGVME